ncbi:M15 family metallopeptidase [Kaistia terrae]|uniref:D-alanyl-D-alanine carboxypeptidase family protein n=1 Tax=Kaistia terrae TaxID=537017 RepID=A0ABW0Q8L0_9HYPH|nr:D-alanyl-D-alanine carboxypeptidase family protein [Kaistia terrae]MCX5581496.1 D-alanyl-D-alanine carboxypeptidase family protein [Kaistia terrae]
MAGPFKNAQGQPYVRTVNLQSILVGHSAEHVDGLTPEMKTRLAALVAAAPPNIQPGLGIYSGYRSPARQAQLYAQAVKKYGSTEAARKWVAPPGKSNHNKGEAVDLAYDGKSLSRAPKEVVKWIHDNAPKHGLYFPLNNENWHIETIGTRPGNANEKEAITSLQKYLVSRGAEIPIDGQWGPKTLAAFDQYSGAPAPSLLERTGLLGSEVAPPVAQAPLPPPRPAPNYAPTGIGSDPDRNIHPGLSPRQIAANHNAYRPSLTTQPLTAPVAPVQRASLGPTPATMQQQYAQYRPTPNLKPQNLSPVSSSELAARVSAAQAPGTSPALSPSTIARYAAGAQAPSPTPSVRPQQISASSPSASISPATPKYGYADRAFASPVAQAQPKYSSAPAAPSGPAISPSTPNYSPVSSPAPQTLGPVQPTGSISPAAPKYETVRTVTYPTISPAPSTLGGIGSDPDRNMAAPMTMAEQYAAYRPTPNTLPAEAKKPEPVVTYKRVPIPTVNDARKVGAVAAPLVQQQALPSVPSPLMANGEDRTPKYFQPKFGLGMAGGMIGGMVAGPLGKMAGKYAGKYLASKLSRTDLPTPENFAGYGMGSIQNIQNGIASPSSYAQAVNNANGYMTQWSNTGPGGAPVQTTSTPGGTTYSTWQQYGPSPMTMVTYGTTGQPRSSSSTTGGYTTSTGNLY